MTDDQISKKPKLVTRIYEKNPLSQRVTPKKEKSNTHWVFMLGSLVAVPAISGDMYLPSLPQLMIDLNTTQEIAQLTVSAAFIGSAIGQLIAGPMLDRFGRRHPVIIGLMIHILTSLICAASSNIYMLISMRVVQGAANSSANVTGLAVLRDTFPGSKGAKMMSRLMLIIGVAPLFAPTLGSTLIDYGGWRMVFLVLAVFGCILLLFVYLKLPDTAPWETLQIAKSQEKLHILKNFIPVLKDRQLVILSICQGLTSAMMICWVVSAPFITEGEWGLNPYQFSLCFAVNGICLVIGSQVNAAIVHKIKLRFLVKTGIIIQIFIISFLFYFTHFFPSSIYMMIPLGAMSFFQNIVGANCFAIAMAPHSKDAGASAAVIGICNALVPAFLSVICAALGGTSQIFTAMLLFIICTNFLLMLFGTDIFKDKSPILKVIK